MENLKSVITTIFIKYLITLQFSFMRKGVAKSDVEDAVLLSKDITPVKCDAIIIDLEITPPKSLPASQIPVGLSSDEHNLTPVKRVYPTKNNSVDLHVPLKMLKKTIKIQKD